MSDQGSRRRRHPAPQSGASTPAREQRRRRDSSVTTDHAEVLRAAHRTQFWLVASALDCADLIAGTVSPALRAQALDLFRSSDVEADETAS